MPENYITMSDEKGSINISEDVIVVIVAAAIAEVEGVAGIAGQELPNFIGKKSVTKGIKVAFDDNSIVVDALIMIRYGSSVTETATKVQAAAANALSAMTGIASPVVNVHVNGIAFDKADRA